MQLENKIEGPVAVIGDVHGQTDLLDSIIDQLEKTPAFENRWVVFIGDLVDRGVDPKGVIQRVLDLAKRHPKTTCVMGNHELAMGFATGIFDAPEYTDWDTRWCEFYGAESTFASYGAEFPYCPGLREAMPDSHVAFLRNLPWSVEHPDCFFVHAGLDPNQSFEVQRRILAERDFTLARPPWLCSKDFANGNIPPDCDQIVVSGHVPFPEVQAYPKRILIDTTGGVEGELSCVLFPEKSLLTSTIPQATPAATSTTDRSPEKAQPPAPKSTTPAMSSRKRRKVGVDSASRQAGEAGDDEIRPRWYEFWK